MEHVEIRKGRRRKGARSEQEGSREREGRKQGGSSNRTAYRLDYLFQSVITI